MSEHPDLSRWWRIRRRFAIAAGALAVLETVALIWLAIRYPAAITALSAVVGWSYSLLGAVVCAYIGFSTWHDIAAARK